jgi:competence ComEA-like helix-hairpin-helix protein
MGKHRWPTAGTAWEPPVNAPGSVPREEGPSRTHPADGSAYGDAHRAEYAEYAEYDAAGLADDPDADADAGDGSAFHRAGGSRRTVSPRGLAGREPPTQPESLTPPGPPSMQWRVARSAALVFLGVALAVGAVLFLVRSSAPSAAAISVQLDATEESAPLGSGPPEGGGSGAPADRTSGGGAAPQDAGRGTAADGDAPEAAPPDGDASHTMAPRSSSDMPQSGAPAGGTVVVYVTGAVASPGVVTVPVGTRLFEVVEQAGGALPGADLEGINLAATPSDGQHVHLLAVGEEPRPDQPRPDASGTGRVPGAASGGVPGGATGTTGGTAGPAGVLDINTASLAEIESLPRVGPVLGQRIIDWRDEHGPFVQASDIDAVPGIGPALLEGILPLIVAR